jgi:hypothetical protein
MNEKCRAKDETLQRIDWVIRPAEDRSDVPKLMRMGNVMQSEALAVFGNFGKEVRYVLIELRKLNEQPVARSGL